MKKINVLLFAMMMFVGSAFAQTKKAVWPEMKAFHALMSSTFHPAEENNLEPLKKKADSLYYAAKIWYAASIPADFKPVETEKTIKQLMKECHAIWVQVDKKAADSILKEMITKAHDTFHKIVGECRKVEGEHK